MGVLCSLLFTSYLGVQTICYTPCPISNRISYYFVFEKPKDYPSTPITPSTPNIPYTDANGKLMQRI